LRLLAIVISSLVWLGFAAAQAAETAPAGPAFVRLDTITVPVFEGDTMTRQASLVLALELEEGRTEADLAPVRRRLVDAYLTELTRIFEERAFAERLIDPSVIKPRLLETTQRVAGPGLVKDILIQQALERARRR
jgi:hypothetical protein